MTNLTYRISISRLVLRIYRARFFYWHFINTIIAGLVEARNRSLQRKVARLRRAVEHCTEQVNCILPELQDLDQLTQDRKNHVLATRSALLEKNEDLQLRASKLSSYLALGAAVRVQPLEYVLRRMINIQSGTESFSRIIARIECDTFYWDLLLWLVVPNRYCEDLLGDLNEEYMLRSSIQGDVIATVWRRGQVAMTLKDILWKKIERLAAIGTLIELITQWFRN